MAALAVPYLWRRITVDDPAARAAAMLRLRLGPLALAIGGDGVAAMSFVFFEQRD